MITITVFQKSEHYVGFESKGHADYADEGYDIICAGISALTVNTVNSIEAFTKDTFFVEQDDGYMKLTIENPVSNSALLLMKSLVLGLQQIQESYGNEYIKLIFKEV